MYAIPAPAATRPMPPATSAGQPTVTREVLIELLPMRSSAPGALRRLREGRLYTRVQRQDSGAARSARRAACLDQARMSVGRRRGFAWRGESRPRCRRPARGARARHATARRRSRFAPTVARLRPAPPLPFVRLRPPQRLPGFGSARAALPLRRQTCNGIRFGSAPVHRSTRIPAAEIPHPFAYTSQTDSCRGAPHAALDRSEPPPRALAPLLRVHQPASSAHLIDPRARAVPPPLERGPRVRCAT